MDTDSPLVFEEPVPEAEKPTSDYSSPVTYKGRSAVLTFLQGEDRVRLVAAPKTPGGKSKLILNVPTYVILNVETAREMDARQTMRAANDENAKSAYSGAQDATVTTGLCGVNDGDEIVFAHSRSQTGASITSGGSGLPHSGDMANAGGFSTPSSSKPKRFFISYVRLRKGEKKSIHTLEFQSVPSHADPTATGDNMQMPLMMTLRAILERVYTKGPKTLLFFISLKSGKGNGLEVYTKHVKPLLHFTRHVVKVHVTTRAHDCEDTLADLDTPVDENCVVVLMGGDGIVNEAVNGLHRRRVALVERFDLGSAPTTDSDGGDGLIRGAGDAGEIHGQQQQQQQQQQLHHHHAHVRSMSGQLMSVGALGSDTAGTSFKAAFLEGGWPAVMPLVATVPTGSACGLAKTLDVLSYTSSVLSLVHLHTCDMDLMHMRFTPNQAMRASHAGDYNTAKIEAKYQAWRAKYADELAERRAARGEKRRVSPYLRDGTGEYADAISLATGCPELEERVAFMSLSFGMANDIDHGSEGLRWLGNGRFAVYGGYMMLRGIRTYASTIRYIPWVGRDGTRVEKLLPTETLNASGTLPRCTITDDCPHCRAHQQRFSETNPLHANNIDFDDEELPWVTVEMPFTMCLLCNERDVAQDMEMAPYNHMSDGCIDLVFTRDDEVTGKTSRYEAFQFFSTLEAGEHVKLPKTCYVKAAAVEITVNNGISMSDGEMMPLSSVRLTKMRNGIQFVRNQPSKLS